jgi:hypothetical protein
MGTPMDGFSYSSEQLGSSAQWVTDASDLLYEPQTEYAANAAPTDSCFGLVPRNSDELARNYRAFYEGALEWVEIYACNVQNAGLNLGQTKNNYDTADGSDR